MHPTRHIPGRFGRSGSRVPRRLRLIWCGTCLGLLLCGLALRPAMAYEPAQENLRPPAASEIDRLAAALVDAPADLQADFAVAVITEMIADYNEEALRARREARGGATSHDLLRWSSAVDAYAAELEAIARNVTAETPIRVLIGARNSITLDIDGNPVVVSSPRVREQSAFEARVLTRFCYHHPCEDLITEYQPPLPTPATTPDTETVWSFSQQAGPTCSTSDGLEFQFRDMHDIGQKREACASIVKELNILSTALAWHIANGERIDWNRLAIHAPPGEAEQQLELAAGGDTIRLELPALSATPRLFDLVRPWLAAKASGQPHYRLVILNADDLMAPLLQP
jgi:hypothetical protein